MENPTIQVADLLVPVELPAGPVLLRLWRDDDLYAVWAALQDAEIRLWNGTGDGIRHDELFWSRLTTDVVP